MNNLELTLTKVENELQNKDVKAVKTLMDIYRNLLDQFYRDGWDSDNLMSFNNELKSHYTNLNILYNTTQSELEKYLNNGEYREAHALTTAIRKIEESLFIVKDALKRVNEFIK